MARLEATLGTRPVARYDRDGRLRFVEAIQSRRYPGTPAEAVQGFLREYPDLLGLRTGQPDLAVLSLEEFLGWQVVRLTQQLQGVTVWGAQTVAAVSSANEVWDLSLSYFPDARPAGDWRLTAEHARQRATEAYPALAQSEYHAERLWYVPEGEPREGAALVPVWNLSFASLGADDVNGFFVDARDGRIVRSQKLAMRAEGLAYPLNPVRDGESPRRVTLRNLTSSYNLYGKYAKVYSYFPNRTGRLPEGVFTGFIAPDANGNYYYPANHLGFPEVQLYYAIDRFHGFFSDLGFRGLDRPQEAIWAYYGPWGDPSQGPYYHPEAFDRRGGIFFAPSTVTQEDATYDAEIIFHEYAHAVVNRIVGSVQSQGFRALNEGFADYFSATFAGDSRAGEYAARVFGYRTPYVRNLASKTVFPRDYYVEEHMGSFIWSGTLWDIRKELGASKADAIALSALLTLTPESWYDTGGEALLAAANRLYGSAARSTVYKVLEQRGIATQEGAYAFQATDLKAGTSANGSVNAASANACLVATASQYRFEVPPAALELQLRMTVSAEARLYIRFRRPILVEDGVSLRDYTTSTGQSVDFKINVESKPEVQAGFYYIAVRHCNTAAIKFTLTASYKLAEGYTAEQPLIAQIRSSDKISGSIPPGPFLHSRYYAIEVPRTITTLKVTLRGNTDVDLYVSAKPFFFDGVGVPAAEFASYSESNQEAVTVTEMTQPAIRPGWYLIGVLNYDSEEVAEFELTATLSGGAGPPPRFMPLDPSQGASMDLPAANEGAGRLSSTQYSVVVPAGSTLLSVTARTASRIRVFLRRGAPVEVKDGWAVSDYSFSPLGYLNYLDITRDSTPPLEAGTYYIAVANFSTQTGSAQISASVATAAPSRRPVISTAARAVANSAWPAAGIASGVFVTVWGTNLASTTRSWQVLDFYGGYLPTRLDGTSVYINSRPAFLCYVSPNQINALLPDDIEEGPAQIEVVTPNGKSDPVTVPTVGAARTFFTFAQGEGKYAAAVHVDGSYIAKPGLIGGLTTRGAAPGETILLFAGGFGPTNPPIRDGSFPSQPAPLAETPVVRIGGVAARVAWAGLVSPGLYQFNVVVPQLADGDATLVAESGGFRTQDGVLLTIKR